LIDYLNMQMKVTDRCLLFFIHSPDEQNDGMKGERDANNQSMALNHAPIDPIRAHHANELTPHMQIIAPF